jgi:uncharacterized membrane protein YbhN (UPF0104 family)
MPGNEVHGQGTMTVQDNSRRPLKVSSRIWSLLRILFAVVLIGFLLSKTNLQQMKLLSGRILWSWLILRFLFYCVMIASKSFQYWILLSKRIPYARMLNVVIMQNTLSNFVTNSAGIASYLTMLHAEEGIKLTRAGVTFVATKTTDLLAMWMCLLGAMLLIWPQIGPLHWLVIVLATGIFLVLIILLIAIVLRQRFVSILRTLIRRLHFDGIRLVERGLEALQSIADHDPQMIFLLLSRSLGPSLIYMSLTVALAYSGLRMFSISISFGAILLVTALIQLLSIVPIQVLGGLGVTEVTSLYLYTMLGIPQQEIVPALIGLRLIAYLMNAAVLLYLPIGTLISKARRSEVNV